MRWRRRLQRRQRRNVSWWGPRLAKWLETSGAAARMADDALRMLGRESMLLGLVATIEPVDP